MITVGLGVFTLVCNTKSVESVNLGVSKWRSVWLDSWGGGGGGGWGLDKPREDI